MNIKEKAKKFYNKLDYFTDGLINRTIAAFGLFTIFAGIVSLNMLNKSELLFLAITLHMTIPVALSYTIIKSISRLIASKFKIPSINISVYLLFNLLIIIFCCDIHNSDTQKNIIFYGTTTLIALLLKIPFLPECKFKTIQEKIEKVVIIIAFIAFIISFITTALLLVILFSDKK